MLSWASKQFEQLAQTVAPPPTDPASRFVYCCQRGEENEALQLASQLPGSGVIVNQSKQQVPLHVACSYGMLQTTRFLLNQPGASLDMTDGGGNTILHCAATCAQPVGLDLVKMLVTEMGANVCAKNFQGQTPYEVATLNSIRQFLLPIQLQQETKEALANGGQGLPPGIDMGGLKIQNTPPPPIPGTTAPPPVGPPPQGIGGPSLVQGIPASPYPQPPNPFIASTSTPSTNNPSPYPNPEYPGKDSQTSATTTDPVQAPLQTYPPISSGVSSPPVQSTAYSNHQETPSNPGPPTQTRAVSAPSSGEKHAYALSGYSSAAIYKAAPGSGGIRPDGFHSSSSDKRLQQKYGHSQSQQYSHLPPPPSSGSSAGALSGAGSYGNSASAPPSGGPNPYAAGLAGRQRPNRYVNYNPVTGQAAPTYSRPSSSYGAPISTSTPTHAQHGVFRPDSNGMQSAPAPASAGMVSPLPPPPYQLQPQQQQPSITGPSPTYTSPMQQAAPASYPLQTVHASTSLQPVPPRMVSSPSSGNIMTSPSTDSASAIFSSPPGEGSTGAGKLKSGAAAQSAEHARHQGGTLNAPVDAAAVAAAAFSSPVDGVVGPSVDSAQPSAVVFPKQVAFSNREVSGVSVLSSASDFFSRPPGEPSADELANPPAALSSPSPVVASVEEKVSQPTARSLTPQVGSAEGPDGEDLDALDDIPLSPAQQQPGANARAGNHSAMPPPPFSST